MEYETLVVIMEVNGRKENNQITEVVSSFLRICKSAAIKRIQIHCCSKKGVSLVYNKNNTTEIGITERIEEELKEYKENIKKHNEMKENVNKHEESFLYGLQKAFFYLLKNKTKGRIIVISETGGTRFASDRILKTAVGIKKIGCVMDSFCIGEENTLCNFLSHITGGYFFLSTDLLEFRRNICIWATADIETRNLFKKKAVIVPTARPMCVCHKKICVFGWICSRCFNVSCQEQCQGCIKKCSSDIPLEKQFQVD